jgi:hypothetical protein
MPGKAVKGLPQTGWGQTKFISMRIGGKHKDGFNDFMSRKDTEIALDIAEFMSQGHKISITWDNNNLCWIVSATCKIEGNVNYDCCMTSRSSEWYEALCMNVYKHKVMCASGSWEAQQETSDWG